jgi:hypothetical protein
MRGSRGRGFVLVFVLFVVALGVGRASLSRFQEQRKAIRDAAIAQRNRLGLKDKVTLFAKYPSPEISLVSTACLQPGGTGELVIKGKFVPGSKVLLESDSLEVVKEALTATEYRATVKAPAGIGPEEANCEIYTPVSSGYANRQNAVVVTGKYEWDLQGPNGLRIKARTASDNRCQSRDGGGEMRYNMEFFRGSETAPFQKRSARLYYSPYESTQYRFSIEEEPAGGDVQKQYEALAKKMGDPNLSDAEREKAMAQMEALSTKLMAELQKMGDPAYARQLEEKKKEFGCANLSLSVQGGQAQGVLQCGEKFGRDLRVAGSVTYLGQ